MKNLLLVTVAVITTLSTANAQFRQRKNAQPAEAAASTSGGSANVRMYSWSCQIRGCKAPGVYYPIDALTIRDDQKAALKICKEKLSSLSNEVLSVFISKVRLDSRTQQKEMQYLQNKASSEVFKGCVFSGNVSKLPEMVEIGKPRPLSVFNCSIDACKEKSITSIAVYAMNTSSAIDICREKLDLFKKGKAFSLKYPGMEAMGEDGRVQMLALTRLEKKEFSKYAKSQLEGCRVEGVN